MSRTSDPELYCDDVEFLLCRRDALCGVRSSLGGQIARLERGGAEGMPNSDPYDDGQVGVGCHRGHFDRDRRLRRVWERVSPSSRAVLEVYYSTRSDLPTGANARLGRFATMAFHGLTGNDRLALEKACQNGTRDVLGPVLARVEKLVRAAHRVFYEARDKDDAEWAA